MTFEERCNKFKAKIEKETNLFKKLTMISFLNKEIEKTNEAMEFLDLQEKKENRPKSSYWKKEKKENE